MVKHQIIWGLCCALLLVLSGCSRQQSDWQKTRETNTADAYEQFLKKYPSGEFTPQAQARVKELYEERDWQKARDSDTPEAYQAFLKEYPEGKWTEEARIRVENFTLAQAPSGTAGTSAGADAGASPDAPPSVAAASATPPPATPPKVVKHVDASSAAPSATAATHNTAGAKSTGQFAVQLGAFKAGAGAAKERWAELQKKYPTALAGLSSSVLPMRSSSSGGSLYRLQAVGLSEQHARDVCGALKAKSEPCLVIPPSPG